MSRVWCEAKTSWIMVQWRLFLHHKNALVQSALSEQEFLARSCMTVLPDPLSSAASPGWTFSVFKTQGEEIWWHQWNKNNN
jgi:hypothetical protein